MNKFLTAAALALALAAGAAAWQAKKGGAQQQFHSKITVYDLATHKTRVVYEADHTIEAPNWSRDGKFLLVNTNGGLYRLPLGGSGQPELEKIELSMPGLRCNNDHDLSRDGKLLAFSAVSANSHGSQVYQANADGSNVRVMTPSTNYFHGWSPDSKWLGVVGVDNGKAELFRVPQEGGEAQRLTSKGGYDDGPEYTPDGQWIYFNSNRTGVWRVWRMPPTGAGPDDAKAQMVTSDADYEDWFPHISPNGKLLLVFSFPKGTPNHNAKMEGVALRLMPLPGKKLKPAKLEVLTTFFGGQGTINVNSWSPDSTKFAYVVYEPAR